MLSPNWPMHRLHAFNYTSRITLVHFRLESAKVFKMQPINNQTAVLINQARQFFQDGDLDKAESLLKIILQIQPKNFDALHIFGVIKGIKNETDEAIEIFKEALSINPKNNFIHFNLAKALAQSGNDLASIPHHIKATQLAPNHEEAWLNYGKSLANLNRLGDAIKSYDRALKINPSYAEAWSNKGIALNDLEHYKEAIACYDKAIKINPNFPAAHYNRGNVLRAFKYYKEALKSYDRAIVLAPNFPGTYYKRGNIFFDLKQYELALSNYDKAARLQPDMDFLYGMRLHTQMHICDWENIDTEFIELAKKIERNEKASLPLTAIATTSSPSLQKKAAENWVRDKYPPTYELPEITKHLKQRKIRIGYFSSDFRNHAVSFLALDLFKNHDRSRFEVIAFSYSHNTQDEMRITLENTFDTFVDVFDKTDKDIALLARNLEIDIAIDLGGHTQDNRFGIFAHRAAPIQVSYLGYLGTTGANYIDYLIADETIIPNANQQHYSEKIAYIPSYQINSKRNVSEKEFSRQESGLPQKGFVFCCFNNNFKINPVTFDSWMRILKQVEGSVLFLYAENDLAAINLKKEANRRGINSDRLIFGKKLPMPEYLARYRVADLFLDTLPYNAGTTASDALWAGLPVLTCIGETFSSRMAASLLNAIHLPELITSTQEEYEALATELATNPQKLSAIRKKLSSNRLTAPLFDTQLFTKNIEAAYTKMYERYQADLPPDHIHIN